MTANGCVLAGLLGTCLVGLGANAQADGLPSRGHRPASDLFGPSWRGYIVAEGPISADGGYWFRIVPAQSIVATPSPSARPGDLSTPLERQVLDQINAGRVARGLRPLTFAPALLSIARSHSKDQARRMMLSHQDSLGRSPGHRLDAANIPWSRHAENVAYAKGHADPCRVIVRTWLNSPAHAANAFNPGFTETAVGVAAAADGTMFVTQVSIIR